MFNKQYVIYGIAGAGICYFFYRWLVMENGIVKSALATTQFDSYGVNSLGDIKAVCKAIANKYHFNANKENLYRMLLETAIVETNAGTAIDKTANSGRGLFQFDKIGYNEALTQRVRVKNNDFANQIAEGYMGNSILQNAYFSAYLARLFYLSKSGAIPSDVSGRAFYWKKYYNTVKGAGSVEHYIKLVNKWIG